MPNNERVMPDRYIYLASPVDDSSLVKVGCSINPEVRLTSLKSLHGVAFNLIHKEFVKNALPIESTCHSLLLLFLYQGEIGSKGNVGHEIFKCSIDIAKQAIAKARLNPYLYKDLTSTKSVNFSAMTRINGTVHGDRFIIKRVGVEVVRLGGGKNGRPCLINTKTGEPESYAHSCKVEMIKKTNLKYQGRMK